MSISFFIGPFDPALWENGNPSPTPVSDLRIDPEDYENKIYEQWPNAIREIKEQLCWLLREGNKYGTRVLLQDNLQYVSFGLGPIFTDFILWHRKIIPAKYPLYFFNSSAWDSLQLLKITTREEVQKYTTFTDI
jgi:hypothetical protein